jgi:hypothetical protein
VQRRKPSIKRWMRAVWTSWKKHHIAALKKSIAQSLGQTR